MDWQQSELEREQRIESARDRVASMSLADLDVAHWDLMRFDTIWPYFERLRNESPIYYHEDSVVGPYWSVTSYDLVKAVDQDPIRFSSEPTIGLNVPSEQDEASSFISMDDPKHAAQRKAVAPVAGPRNLAAMESTIRERVNGILDSLPIGEEFNWVEKVSIELTTQMLATLFDFPFEDRYKLTRWSDVATSPRKAGLWDTLEERQQELNDCLAYMTRLRDERVDSADGFDLLTMLAHNADTRNMGPREFLGNLLLLIVGGNDTTRNSISGGVVAMNRFPDQFENLKENRNKIPNAVAEIIRWQTPLAFMRRTTTQDVELDGNVIPKGERVLMWYASGNRDESVFEDADRLDIDRANVRQHLSFGYGVHRCMGNRVAELQLRLLWEEMLERYDRIEVTGAPIRAISNFVRGYTHLPVKLHAA
ncbi:MAG: cytochrome P450 [Pseudomonadota bacterium]